MSGRSAAGFLASSLFIFQCNTDATSLFSLPVSATVSQLSIEETNKVPFLVTMVHVMLKLTIKAQMLKILTEQKGHNLIIQTAK